MENKENPRALLESSLLVLKTEILKLLEISQGSQHILDPESIKALNDMTRTLVIMDKNEKAVPQEDEDENYLASLTDEELRAKALEIVGPPITKKPKGKHKK